MSSNADRAAQYAEKHGIAKATTELGELVEDDERRRRLHRDHQRAASRPDLAAAAARQACAVREAAGADARRCARDGRGLRNAGVVMATNHHLRNAATHRAMREAIKAGTHRQAAVRPRLPRRLSAAASAGLAHRQAEGRRRRHAGHHRAMTPTRLRFVLDDEPRRGDRHESQGGHGAGGPRGRRDGRGSLLRAALLAQFHDAFTTKYATTGFEVHGDEGSLIGRDCMTQAPIGEVLLRSAAGEEALKLDARKPLCALASRLFQDAVAGRGAPSATGEDGVSSLSVALSTRSKPRAPARADRRRSERLRSSMALPKVISAARGRRA